jgi:hypothetical protein
LIGAIRAEIEGAYGDAKRDQRRLKPPGSRLVVVPLSSLA